MESDIMLLKSWWNWWGCNLIKYVEMKKVGLFYKVNLKL